MMTMTLMNYSENQTCGSIWFKELRLTQAKRLQLNTIALLLALNVIRNCWAENTNDEDDVERKGRCTQ
jgi:hypothetical protein